MPAISTVLVNGKPLYTIDIKKPDSKNNGLSMDRYDQKLPDNLRARYEEIEDLPEPVIESQHLSTFSVHETFRAIEPVAAFNSVAFSTATSTIRTPPQRVACG